MLVYIVFVFRRVYRMATPSKTPPGADPKQLERTGTVREIGSQAVWSLSSCKPGQPQNKNSVGCVFDLGVILIQLCFSRFWSGSAEGRQPGDLLAVRWIPTSLSQHTVQVFSTRLFFNLLKSLWTFGRSGSANYLRICFSAENNWEKTIVCFCFCLLQVCNF